MDSATVSDHFQPWRHEGGHAPFSLAWMTAVGERTKRLFLGTSVLTPTFRYNPAVIAQAFATMGCLYPDRIFLGVGTGESLNEIATGYEGEWPMPATSPTSSAASACSVARHQSSGFCSDQP